MKQKGWVILSCLIVLIVSMRTFSNGQGAGSDRIEIDDPKREAIGVCPPFNLLAEDGKVIDPTKNLNADKPYSPKKTCGKCHDYDKITQGYHFQQGKGEAMTPDFQELYAWCTTPGQYGGRW